MPELVSGMQMCLRLYELNHPFWEEGGVEREKKKDDTEGTLGECKMRVCCRSSRTLPAAELAHGQAARGCRDAAGTRVMLCPVGTITLPCGEMDTGPSPPSQWPLAPRSHRPGRNDEV